VIVVDNAPSDDSTECMVRDLYGSDERIRYVREIRPGASLARNLGAQLGGGEFVAFTDDDAEVDQLWLAALVAGFRAGPRVVCVTGLTLPRELETPAQHAFEEYGGMGLGFVPRLYDLGPHRGDTLLYPYTAGVFGASNNAAFRREDFMRHGGFDLALGPATPAFGAEDLDLFLSVIMRGDQIAYQPAAIVRHAHRATYEELYWQVFTYSVGLTALLTKWALSDRRVAMDLVRRVPLVVPAALFRSHRGGADAGIGQYPEQLRWLERAGYLYGPFAYLRSLITTHAVRRRPSPAH
jgi:O-antigen biosynthesis protein